MKAIIKPGRAHGSITAPPSKSIAHRLLICAALADGESEICGISDCEDVRATVDCLSALGARFELCGKTVTVTGTNINEADGGAILECRESGSTLRFLAPLAMLTANGARLHGAGSLLARPMTVYEELFGKEKFTVRDGYIDVKGPIEPGNYAVRGDISSQFITGLIFALSTLKGDSEIRISEPVESRSYINLTIAALAEFGVCVLWKSDTVLYIKGGQRPKACKTNVEADASGAAFLEALNHLGSCVNILGLNPKSLQGDAVYGELFDALDEGTPTIDISDCPDLGPILFALAAAKNGATFTGTRRLRIKESDRASAMAEELSKLGARLDIYPDSVVVHALPLHAPIAPIDSHNDHRIVMSMAVLLTLFGGEINGAEAVRKSYPEFFTHLSALGIEVTTYEA